MSATASTTETTEDRIPTPRLRLLLAPLDQAPALLDGAWWPRSRDLTAELPALVAAFDPLCARITRVTVNPTYWPVVPRKVPVPGHTVHVGWFGPEQDPHKLRLFGYHTGRWDLLIVPPQTPAATAAWLMTAAADPLRTSTAGELMREAELLQPSVGVDGAQEAVWETEGGHAPRSVAPLVSGVVHAPEPAKGR